jgi:Mg2+ and Co2+ transporter CorA
VPWLLYPPEAPPPLVEWIGDSPPPGIDIPEPIARYLRRPPDHAGLREIDGTLVARITAASLHENDDLPALEHLDLILRPNAVLLRREPRRGICRTARTEDLTAEWARTPPDQRDSSVLFMQVLDSVSDGYRQVIAEVRSRVERLEEELLQSRPHLNRVLGDLLELSRDLAAVRDGLLPLRSDVRELLHLRDPEERGLVSMAGLKWLKELLHDLTAEVPAVLDSADRRIESALMQVQGERSEATNRVVFLLTIVTVAFFIPTLLTGLYGMNVPLPAKNSDAVFWALVGVAVVLLGLAGIVIRRLRLWGNVRAVAPDRPDRRGLGRPFLRPGGRERLEPAPEPPEPPPSAA